VVGVGDLLFSIGRSSDSKEGPLVEAVAPHLANPYNARMSPRRRARHHTKPDELAGVVFPNPYRDLWESLTPLERSRRAWRLRGRLKNLQAIHDAKTIPEL
jgi:hypothetical protein